MKNFAAPHLWPRRVLMLGALLAAIAPASGQAPQPRVIELAIVARKVEGAQVTRSGRAAGVIRVTQGEEIELVWGGDEDATLHLHGYNIETRLQAGGTASMRLKARASGRFAVETHGIGAAKGRHLTLVYLEVHPR